MLVQWNEEELKQIGDWGVSSGGKVANGSRRKRGDRRRSVRGRQGGKMAGENKQRLGRRRCHIGFAGVKVIQYCCCWCWCCCDCFVARLACLPREQKSECPSLAKRGQGDTSHRILSLSPLNLAHFLPSINVDVAGALAILFPFFLLSFSFIE